MVRKKNLQKLLKSLEKDQQFLKTRKMRFGSDQSEESEQQKKKQQKKRRRRRLYYLLGGAAATGLVLSNRGTRRSLNRSAYAVTHPFSNTNGKTFTGNMAEKSQQRSQIKAQQEDIKNSGLTSGEYHTKIAQDLQVARHRHKFKDPGYTPPKPGMLWTSRTTRDELDAFKNYRK